MPLTDQSGTSVLYLAPHPPSRSGIADYAAAFSAAMRDCTGCHLDWSEHDRVTGNSLRDFEACRRRVQKWIEDGVLCESRLVHAEIGIKQFDEFYTLYWIRRLAPAVRYSLTVHDPPLVVAPALYPLCFGLRSNFVRHVARALDYTQLARGVVGRVLRSAAAVVTLTEAGAASLESHYGLQNACSIPHLLASLPPEIERERPAAQTITVLFAGFWAPSKGIQPLIRAMEDVQRECGSRIRLLLTGGSDGVGSSDTFCERMRSLVMSSPAARLIDIPGYLPRETMQQTFASADIFVLPYIGGLGPSASGPLLNAMSCGLPIIATEIDTFKAEVSHGQTGELVSPNDPNALASAIIRLANDAALRTRLGKAARKRAIEVHGANAVTGQFMTLFERIMRA
ncbi:MAG: glycosyltransferase [Capsulimonadaceae bacterium]|nr:glycosyltransferase [Capsulimonadaceae bacterium]